jgi:pyrophosphatase PpaX
MVTAYAGVGDVLRAIKTAGRKTGLVTSKNREGAIRGLRLAGFEEYLDVLVCADEVTNPKPHREPVDRAVALLEADPATTVYVGDSIHDLVSGRSAGVRIAAVLWGPFGREQLAPGEPDWWLERPEDLLDLLRS